MLQFNTDLTFVITSSLSAPVEKAEPIQLFSADPKEYRSDVLRKIVPIITNPRGESYD